MTWLSQSCVVSIPLRIDVLILVALLALTLATLALVE